MRTFLRGCLRAINYLLAIVGVLMVAYALFMYVDFTEAHRSVPAPPDRGVVASIRTDIPTRAINIVDPTRSEQALGYAIAGWNHPATTGSNGSGLTECVPLITHAINS